MEAPKENAKEDGPAEFPFLRKSPTELKKLLKDVNDWNSLEAVISKLIGSKGGFMRATALKAAIAEFEGNFVRKVQANFDFYQQLLPQIIHWATEEDGPSKVKLLYNGKEDECSFTSKECRFILANAFFLNVDSPNIRPSNFGRLDFYQIYVTGARVALERIICQLSYFYYFLNNEDDNRTVTFKRLILNKEIDWLQDKTPVSNTKVTIHNARMEDVQSNIWVDFANKYLHIGEIIPSCTQEEVLFSCCPEAFIGIFICDKMEDDEAIIITGLRRFSEYSGYLHTFRFTGFAPPRVVDFIAIDAVFANHYVWDSSVVRDMNKAYLGFHEFAGKTISTGHWGCGAFGGNKAHKFLQQLCAATVAKTNFDYACFMDKDGSLEKLQKMWEVVVSSKATVGEIAAIIKQGKGKEDFYAHAMKELNRISHQL